MDTLFHTIVLLLKCSYCNYFLSNEAIIFFFSADWIRRAKKMHARTAKYTCWVMKQLPNLASGLSGQTIHRHPTRAERPCGGSGIWAAKRVWVRSEHIM